MSRDMRKFLAASLLMLGCVAALLAFMLLSGIFLIGCQHEDGYEASLADKVARLKSVASPKIILAGNSNLSFGINSAMIEDALNMPVVNLGFHGGLGNAFHENIARLSINSGDIVIVCHSTYSDDNRITDIELCWITLEYRKDLWEILRPEDYCDMAEGFPKYWLKSLLTLASRMFPRKPTSPPYARDAFNKYGDVVAKPESARYPQDVIFKPSSIKVPSINETCTSRINSLNEYVKSRGAVLLVAGYPIASGEYTPPAEDYAEFQKELAGKLDCEIISDFRDYFIPYEYFYNTKLHLDEHGAELRTQQLIKDIKAWQAGRK